MLEVVRAIGNRGFDLTTARSDNGEPMLHIAARSNLHRLVRPLCDMGCDIGALDEEGVTASESAAKNGFLATVRVLRSVEETVVYRRASIAPRQAMPAAQRAGGRGTAGGEGAGGVSDIRVRDGEVADQTTPAAVKKQSGCVIEGHTGVCHRAMGVYESDGTHNGFPVFKKECPASPGEFLHLYRLHRGAGAAWVVDKDRVEDGNYLLKSLGAAPRRPTALG